MDTDRSYVALHPDGEQPIDFDRLRQIAGLMHNGAMIRADVDAMMDVGALREALKNARKPLELPVDAVQSLYLSLQKNPILTLVTLAMANDSSNDGPHTLDAIDQYGGIMGIRVLKEGGAHEHIEGLRREGKALKEILTVLSADDNWKDLLIKTAPVKFPALPTNCKIKCEPPYDVCNGYTCLDGWKAYSPKGTRVTPDSFPPSTELRYDPATNDLSFDGFCRLLSDKVVKAIGRDKLNEHWESHNPLRLEPSQLRSLPSKLWFPGSLHMDKWGNATSPETLTLMHLYTESLTGPSVLVPNMSAKGGGLRRQSSVPSDFKVQVDGTKLIVSSKQVLEKDFECPAPESESESGFESSSSSGSGSDSEEEGIISDFNDA